MVDYPRSKSERRRVKIFIWKNSISSSSSLGERATLITFHASENTHANANDKQQRKGRASVFLLDWFFYSFFLLKKYKYFFVNISIFHWGSCMWKREINLIIIYSLSLEICVVVMVSGISEGISFIFLLFFPLILVEMLLFGRLFPNNFGLIGRVYIHVGLVIFKYGVSL